MVATISKINCITDIGKANIFKMVVGIIEFSNKNNKPT